MTPPRTRARPAETGPVLDVDSRLARLERAVVSVAMALRRSHGNELFRDAPELREIVETHYGERIELR